MYPAVSVGWINLMILFNISKGILSKHTCNVNQDATPVL